MSAPPPAASLPQTCPDLSYSAPRLPPLPGTQCLSQPRCPPAPFAPPPPALPPPALEALNKLSSLALFESAEWASTALDMAYLYALAYTGTSQTCLTANLLLLAL
ncbi:hypothetical protein B0H13DRAFT_2345190 [Mycena leptocephala]|nr:hypothetical protein B0H13DRAFT_2345190 [Mycena leptocephala]